MVIVSTPTKDLRHDGYTVRINVECGVLWYVNVVRGTVECVFVYILIFYIFKKFLFPDRDTNSFLTY